MCFLCFQNEFDQIDSLFKCNSFSFVSGGKSGSARDDVKVARVNRHANHGARTRRFLLGSARSDGFSGAVRSPIEFRDVLVSANVAG